MSNVKVNMKKPKRDKYTWLKRQISSDVLILIPLTYAIQSTNYIYYEILFRFQVLSVSNLYDGGDTFIAYGRSELHTAESLPLIVNKSKFAELTIYSVFFKLC